MKRKEFLKLGGATLATMLGPWPVSTYANNPLLDIIAKSAQTSGRVLVLIQLNGGNDGLNTVIPLDQYGVLSSKRANILIPSDKVLALSTSGKATGLHPAMTRVRDMYEAGNVNIIQGVSYPNPNLSHFRATDIWLTGSSSNQYLDTGWLGRYLSETYAGFPVGYPNTTMPDPLAIQIGSGVSAVCEGPTSNVGMAISDINNFYNIVNNSVDPAPATPAGHELTFIRYVIQQTQQYTGVIRTAALKANNLSTLYPGSNSLSDQLKIVARLIAGGLQTPLYVVSMGSFDTHAAQTDATNHALGTHAVLLQKMSDAVGAFFDDCKLLKVDQRVAAMTFSEFGRRIVSNGSGGTDHGTAAPVFAFGNPVNAGIIGSNPIIPATATANDNLAMQTDFRSLYASVLSDWFEVDPAVMSKVLLQSVPSIPPVFRKSSVTGLFEDPYSEALVQNYPNPVRSTTTIDFYADGNELMLLLLDAQGRLVNTLASGVFSEGKHSVVFSRAGLPSGMYFYRLINGNRKATRKMVVAD
jgi:uncharacterized protein (DUF1501 family)